MSNESPGRMKIVNNGGGAPAQRTAAQQAAARRNGALSRGPVTAEGKARSSRNGALGRGPVTAEGKARSSRNAIKHGLFARQFAPPGDMRKHDRLFNSIRAELYDEFQPETFIECSTVDRMAHEYVNLARVHQMIEMIQRPTPLQPDDAEKWKKVQDVKKDMRLLMRVIAQAENRDNFTCSRKDATRCAQIIRGLGEQVMQDLAEVQQHSDAAAEEIDRDGPHESETLDPDEDEYEAKRGFWIKINEDGHPWYDDVLDVAATLRGSKPTSRDFRLSLAELLAHRLKHLQNYVKFHRSVLRKADMLCDATILSLTNSPEKLMLLQEYQRKTEISIERKERALRRQRR